MEVENQQTSSMRVTPGASPEHLKKQRKEAMKIVHDFVLPEMFGARGWKKVADKHGTPNRMFTNVSGFMTFSFVKYFSEFNKFARVHHITYNENTKRI